MRNKDRFKEEGMPFPSYRFRWYAPIGLNSRGFRTRSIIFFFEKYCSLLWIFLLDISHMEKIDTREPELSHRCETERVLKEKVHRFCRVDFVDMHRLDSNSIDNFFGELLFSTRVFLLDILYIQKIVTYNKLSLLLPEDDRPLLD